MISFNIDLIICATVVLLIALGCFWKTKRAGRKVIERVKEEKTDGSTKDPDAVDVQ